MNMRKKNPIRHNFLLAMFSCLMIWMLCGCTGEAFTQKERTALEKKGLTIMEEYADKYLSGAEVLSAKAHQEYMLGSMWYLTEYVKGEYQDGDGTWNYYVNTETGQIYSQKPFERVKTLISEEIKNLLGLPGESELLEIIVSPMELPHREGHYGEDTNWYDEIWCHEVLPIDMTDREWVYLAMAGRSLIPVELITFRVPEKFDLSGYHINDVQQGIFGLSLGKIMVSDGEEELVICPGEFLSYLMWEEKEECGFILRGIKRADREDMEGEGEGEGIRMAHAEFDLDDMMALSRTEDGYTLHISENRQELAFEVLFLAEEGSLAVKSMYEAKKISEEYSRTLGWERREDGRLQLCVWNTNRQTAEFPFSTGEDTELVKSGE